MFQKQGNRSGSHYFNGTESFLEEKEKQFPQPFHGKLLWRSKARQRFYKKLVLFNFASEEKILLKAIIP